MNQALQVCVIIPTKNRPRDLELAVRSICVQTVVPRSLVIVDQSADHESRRRVEAELAEAERRRGARWKLKYVHDPSISGLAMARNRAMAIADGDVWAFLDDDVILEPDFLEQLLAVYRDFPGAAGVSGIITNQRRPPARYRLWSALFVHGPFRDDRQPIYWNADRLRNSPPLVVDRFTGAAMSFRAGVVRGKFFDENLRGVSDGEDVDFCMRLGPDSLLLLAPRARLEHRRSLLGRPKDHWLRQSVRGDLFLYRKNWNKGFFNFLCHLWLWVGYCLVALLAGLRRASLDPWRALRTGAEEAAQAAPRPRSRGAT